LFLGPSYRTSVAAAECYASARFFMDDPSPASLSALADDCNALALTAQRAARHQMSRPERARLNRWVAFAMSAIQPLMEVPHA